MDTYYDDVKISDRLKLLSDVYAANAVPTMCVGNDDQVLFMNVAMSDLTEYEPREIGLVSAWLQVLLAENGSDMLYRHILDLNEFFEPQEFMITLKTGISLCVEVVVFTVTGSLAGEDVRILQFIDKTEHRVQREALAVSEHEKSVILNSISDWIVLYDSQRVIQWINQTAKKHMKMETEKIVGKRCYETWCDRDDSCDECPVLGAFVTGHLKDRNITLHDGRVLQVKAYPYRNEQGALQGVVQVTRDVTEYHLAREALKESERFAFGVINALPINIAVLDEDGTIIAVNSAWRKYALANPPIRTNVNEGANYLAVCDAAKGEGAETAKAFSRGIRDVLSGFRETYECEYSCGMPDQKRMCVGRVSRFRDDGPPRVVVSHEDVTPKGTPDTVVASGESK